MKAVSMRQSVGGHAHDRTTDNIFAMQQDQPVHGPYELGVAISPAHAPWYRKRLQSGLNQPGNQIFGGLALLHGLKTESLALVACDSLEFFGLCAALLRKGLAGLRNLSFAVIRNRHGRALDNKFLIRLRINKGLDDDGEPARAGVSRQSTVFKPGVIEGLSQVFRKGIHQAPERLGRQLLGPKLDQKIGSLGHVYEVPVLRAPALSTIGKPRDSRLA